MPSSHISVVPELSRSFKYQEYRQQNCESNISNRSFRSLVWSTSQQTQDSSNYDVSETTQSFRCFEVRPSTNGVGMFATKPIATGDLIIDSEEPIVSTTISLFPSTMEIKGGEADGKRHEDDALTEGEKIMKTLPKQDSKKTGDQHEESLDCHRCMLDPPFCQTCGTPIGNLRHDHLKAPLHLDLPGIEQGDVGLIFTFDGRKAQDERVETSKIAVKQVGKQQNNSDEQAVIDRACKTYWSPYSQHVAWCSKECWESRCDMHTLVCLGMGLGLVSQTDDEVHQKQLQPICKQVKSTVNNRNERHHLKIEASVKNTLRLQKFLEKRDNPKIFELAIQAILLVLLSARDNCIHEQNNKLSTSFSSDCVRYNYRWWEDYGSHPLWWTIGATENRKDRFQCSREFANILKDWCKERINFMAKIRRSEQAMEDRCGPRKRRRIHAERFDIFTSTDISSDGIDNLCSENNIGALLGMLQCNVMEFSYPSPLQQYMEQAEEFLEEDNLVFIDHATASKDHEDMHHHDKQDEDELAVQDDTMKHNALVHGCEWLRKRYRSAPKEDESRDCHTFFKPPEPVVGSGLYPLLTLANHHCNPNASIEFLQESNRGSMVALRPIKSGEEICITYVPNGDHHITQQLQGESEQDDKNSKRGTNSTISETGDENEDCSGDYFRHFKPTRTWRWLNHQIEGSEASGDEDCDTSHDTRSEKGNDSSTGEEEHKTIQECDDHQSMRHYILEENELGNDQSAPKDLVDGANPEQRGLALLEYGFVCKCARCEYENRHAKAASQHYCRGSQY